MKLHPVVARVTDRVRERSADSRNAYLRQVDAAAGRDRGSDRLGCANVAHAFAALPANDKFKVVAERVPLPPGYTLSWAGQFEYQLRAKETLKVVVPFTVLLIFLLLYLNTQSVAKTLIILAAVPFSAVGAIWLLYLLDYNMSVAVWVGLIALLGVDAETGVFMLLYLDLAYQERREKGPMKSWEDVKQAVIAGAVRPAMVAGPAGRRRQPVCQPQRAFAKRQDGRSSREFTGETQGAAS